MYSEFDNPYFSRDKGSFFLVSDCLKNEKIFKQYQGDSFNVKAKIYPDNSINCTIAKSPIFGFQSAKGKKDFLGFRDPVFTMYEDAKKLHYQRLKVIDIISNSFESVNDYLSFKMAVRSSNKIFLSDDERQFLNSLRRSLRTDNLKKTKECLFDYVQCNDWTWFFTGTFDPKKYDSTNADELKKVLQKWFNNMVSRYHISYIIIFEYHKKGGIHIHGLIKENSLYPLKLVASDTKIYYGFKKPMRDSTAIKHGLDPVNGRVVYNLKTWRFGWSTAIAVYGRTENIAKYVTKYITKTNQKIMGRYFWHSQDLDKPLIHYLNIDYDVMQLVQYHGFKYMYLSGESKEVQEYLSTQEKTYNYTDYVTIIDEIENIKTKNTLFTTQDNKDKNINNFSEWGDLSEWVDLSAAEETKNTKTKNTLFTTQDNKDKNINNFSEWGDLSEWVDLSAAPADNDDFMIGWVDI